MTAARRLQNMQGILLVSMGCIDSAVAVSGEMYSG